MTIVLEGELFETVGALVYFNHEKRLIIRVYPQEDMEPHFMLIDDEPPHTTKKIGISLFEPKYIKLPLERKEQDWILSADEKRELMKILNEQNGFRRKYRKRTNWQAVLGDYNWELNEQVVPEDLPMPDYMQLPEN